MAKPSPDLALAAARAVERLGQADFYESLLELVATVASHDLVALVRYSRTAAPDLILPRVEPTEAIQAYHRHFFALDPFYMHWVSGGDIGVYRLRALATDVGRSRYAREFLSAMSIHDEIAVFLPAIGEASPTLILDRAHRSFDEAEVNRMRQLFPLLAALHRQHLHLFITAGTDVRGSPLGREHPLRLLDQRGATIFATRAWTRLTEPSDSPLLGALRVLEERGPCVMPIPGLGLLRRTRLPADFGPAPSGFCDEIAPEAPAEGGMVSGLPSTFSEALTEREQQVVLLTLQGYPIIEIARKLGLSRGTVKNHRVAIYRKLDITTERELFGEYMTAMRETRLRP
jgi:DNA-binding CsgD family transcriptional regulator